MNNKIYVTKSSLPKFEEYVDKIKGIWDTCWMTNCGPLHQEFELELKKYLRFENLELFVNGHMALDIAIKGLNLGGEVITTPYSFVSTTHALTMNGITPVFCDIKSDDFTIDEDKIESLITDKTSAILAVHVYGIPCNLKRLSEIAEKYNLKLIYDAAHTFGIEVNEQSIACFGDVSMFSFHATKVFNSIEGGALTFKDLNLSKKFRNLRNFGIEGAESITEIGLNAKMNEFSAAMGICNLRHLDDNILKRKKITEIYVEGLSECTGIKLIDYNNLAKRNIHYNYSYFPVVINEELTGFTRDELFAELEKNNIYSRKYFYPLISNCECYAKIIKQYDLPNAEYIADRVLTLPLYSDLEEDAVHKIIMVIKSLYKGR